MCGRLDGYLEAFAGVGANTVARVSNCPGDLVQPLLLLAVLDLIGSGHIKRNFISPDAQLVSSFSAKCSEAIRPASDLAAPFQDLQHTGFWHLVPSGSQGQERVLPATSVKQLRELYLGARFSDDLYPLLVMESSRNKLYKVLLASGCLQGGDTQ